MSVNGCSAAAVRNFWHAGNLGWKPIGDYQVPYIVRSNDEHNSITKFVSIRMAETQLLRKFLIYLSPEIYSCMPVVRSFYINEFETMLLNEINSFSKHVYGDELFVFNKDDVIQMEDLEKIYNFLEVCYNKLLGNSTLENDKKCGFIHINSETMVPYCVKDNKKYLPLLYFDGVPDNLKSLAVELEEWDMAYLRFCCKVQGICKELSSRRDMCVVVSLDDIKNNLPSGTNYLEYWPIDSSACKLSANKKDASIKSPFDCNRIPTAPAVSEAVCNTIPTTTPNTVLYHLQNLSMWEPIVNEGSMILQRKPQTTIDTSPQNTVDISPQPTVDISPQPTVNMSSQPTADMSLQLLMKDTSLLPITVHEPYAPMAVTNTLPLIPCDWIPLSLANEISYSTTLTHHNIEDLPTREPSSPAGTLVPQNKSQPAEELLLSRPVMVDPAVVTYTSVFEPSYHSIVTYVQSSTTFSGMVSPSVINEVVSDVTETPFTAVLQELQNLVIWEPTVPQGSAAQHHISVPAIDVPTQLVEENQQLSAATLEAAPQLSTTFKKPQSATMQRSNRTVARRKSSQLVAKHESSKSAIVQTASQPVSVKDSSSPSVNRDQSLLPSEAQQLRRVLSFQDKRIPVVLLERIDSHTNLIHIINKQTQSKKKKSFHCEDKDSKARASTSSLDSLPKIKRNRDNQLLKKQKPSLPVLVPNQKSPVAIKESTVPPGTSLKVVDAQTKLKRKSGLNHLSNSSEALTPSLNFERLSPSLAVKQNRRCIHKKQISSPSVSMLEQQSRIQKNIVPPTTSYKVSVAQTKSERKSGPHHSSSSSETLTPSLGFEKPSASLVKRNRGRPPKKQTPSSVSIIEQQSLIQEKVVTPTTSLEVSDTQIMSERKSGPYHSSSSSEALTPSLGSELLSPSLAVKRNRGRPPKKQKSSPSASMLEQQSLIQENIVPLTKSLVVSDALTKSERKSSPYYSNNSSEVLTSSLSSELLSPSLAVKRNRGRPPKKQISSPSVSKLEQQSRIQENIVPSTASLEVSDTQTKSEIKSSPYHSSSSSEALIPLLNFEGPSPYLAVKRNRDRPPKKQISSSSMSMLEQQLFIQENIAPPITSLEVSDALAKLERKIGQNHSSSSSEVLTRPLDIEGSSPYLAIKRNKDRPPKKQRFSSSGFMVNQKSLIHEKVVTPTTSLEVSDTQTKSERKSSPYHSNNSSKSLTPSLNFEGPSPSLAVKRNRGRPPKKQKSSPSVSILDKKSLLQEKIVLPPMSLEVTDAQTKSSRKCDLYNSSKSTETVIPSFSFEDPSPSLDVKKKRGRPSKNQIFSPSVYMLDKKSLIQENIVSPVTSLKAVDVQTNSKRKSGQYHSSRLSEALTPSLGSELLSPSLAVKRNRGRPPKKQKSSPSVSMLEQQSLIQENIVPLTKSLVVSDALTKSERKSSPYHSSRSSEALTPSLGFEEPSASLVKRNRGRPPKKQTPSSVSIIEQQSLIQENVATPTTSLEVSDTRTMSERKSGPYHSSSSSEALTPLLTLGDSLSSNTVKRKRGRPLKNQELSSSASMSDQLLQVNVLEKGVSSSTSLKTNSLNPRSMRNKKSLNMGQCSCCLNISIPSSLFSSKRKRGRPPKKQTLSQIGLIQDHRVPVVILQRLSSALLKNHSSNCESDGFGKKGGTP